MSKNRKRIAEAIKQMQNFTETNLKRKQKFS